jgi:hypothetical protein
MMRSFEEIIDFNAEHNQLAEDTFGRLVAADEVVSQQLSWILRNTTPSAPAAIDNQLIVEEYIVNFYGVPKGWSKKVIAFCEAELIERGVE